MRSIVMQAWPRIATDMSQEIRKLGGSETRCESSTHSRSDESDSAVWPRIAWIAAAPLNTRARLR